jgi:succinate dehydrogenase/fumarate reductase cytochrome b subunit
MFHSLVCSEDIHFFGFLSVLCFALLYFLPVVSYASYKSLGCPQNLLQSIDAVVATGGLPLMATKFAVGAPLVFHYINGLRHLVDFLCVVLC